MPKVQLSVSQRMREFPNELFINDNEKLFCSLCNVFIRYQRKSIVQLHTRSAKHLKRKKKLTETDDEEAEEECPSTSKEAPNALPSPSRVATVKTLRENTTKMISVFSDLSIPLVIFKNKSFRQWLAKDTCVKRPPSDSVVRKCLTECIANDTELTKKKCREKDVFVIVDENIIINNRTLLNVFVGPLGIGEIERERPRLVTSKVVERCSADIVVDLVLDAINDVEVPRNNLLFLVSYNAPYMQAVTDRLSGVCKRLLHSTCWAHVLRVCAEEIRSTLKFADRFVSCVTNALIAAPQRKEFLLDCLVKEGLTSRLPPDQIVTRWSTWLQAVKYHSDNYNAIKCWIHEEDQDSSADMMELATLVTDVNQSVLTSQLLSVARVADAICLKIKMLESRQDLDASQVWFHLNDLLELVQVSGVPCKRLMGYLGGRHTACQFWNQVQVLDPTRVSLDPFSNGIPKELLRFADANTSQTLLAHEWSQYKLLLQDENQANVSTLKFWKRNKNRMPHLSSLATKALTVPACSSAVERRFSTLNWILSRKDSLTKPNTVLQLRLAFNASSDDNASDDENSESTQDTSYLVHD